MSFAFDFKENEINATNLRGLLDQDPDAARFKAHCQQWAQIQEPKPKTGGRQRAVRKERKAAPKRRSRKATTVADSPQSDE